MKHRRKPLFSLTIREGALRINIIHPDGREEKLQRKHRRLQLVDKNLVLSGEDEWRVLPKTAAVRISG